MATDSPVRTPPSPTERFLAWLATLAFRYRRLMVVTMHLVLVLVSYALAFVLRFDGLIPPAYDKIFLSTLIPLVVFRLGAFAFYRLYSGWWRYVGMRDMFALLKAIAISSALFTALLVFTGQAYQYPRSVIVIDAGLTLFFIGGVRFALRALRENRRPVTGGPRLRRVLIVGAGDAGELLLREMHNNSRLGYVPVGFVDDDVRKTGFHIHGVPVLGTTESLGEILTTNAADELIIAIPSASRDQIQKIVNRCLATRLPFKILPAIAALSGRVQITGAGGSIGAELARQIATFDPAALTLIERSENALFLIEQELYRKHPTLAVRPAICDICESADVARLFREVRPEIVYHAAAFKHVPMMEAHVSHAVHNNVFGTRNVAEAAVQYGATFVLISTDKAVSPTNIMGATKRLAEQLVLSLADGRAHHFVAVRFGNVLGSNGSVVPLFSEQIADGGPVTVTHPEATRYFMTIPEAVQLVLQASALDEARDRIVMLEMGHPVKIVDLARNLIRLSGLEPDTDIPIVFTGLRPGEKLHEQLTSDTEETMPTRFEKIRIVKTGAPRSLDHQLGQLWDLVAARDERAIVRKLQELVPEFSPQAALIARLRERAAAPEPRHFTKGA